MALKVRVTPDQGSAKWLQRMQASSEQITNGVNNVTVAPGVAAAAATQKWLQNTQAAAAKFKRNVGAVTLESWKSSMLNVGVPRVSQGAAAKVGKVTTFNAQFYPYLETVMSQVHNMPNVTLEDNIARATAMMRGAAKFQRNAGA